MSGMVAISGAMSSPLSTSAPNRWAYLQSSDPSRHDGVLGSCVMLSAADAGTIPALHNAWVGS